jgi:hypothetical protein
MAFCYPFLIAASVKYLKFIHEALTILLPRPSIFRNRGTDITSKRHFTNEEGLSFFTGNSLY